MNAPALLVTAPVWMLFGFTVVILSGIVLLLLLQRLKVRQYAYEDAPESHQEKSGTPTMGGIAIAIAIAAMLVVDAAPSLAGKVPLLVAQAPLLAQLSFLVLACAAIGFVDDFLAIRLGRNRGLRARTKFLATALVAVIFLRSLGDSADLFPRDVLFHAGTFALIAPHWLWLLLGIGAITATIHAVNLTDGLDGLAAGTIVPPLAVFVWVAVEPFNAAAVIGASVGIGACLGFLLFNRHPAQMFMGDTGSLALGALLSGVAILTGEMLLLVLVGGVFVVEALSVILQVAYFKATGGKANGGKRILRMSPLHHHFELGGWPETKVTWRFWLASLLCSLAGWAIVR